jgi:hypothetical protein
MDQSALRHRGRPPSVSRSYVPFSIAAILSLSQSLDRLFPVQKRWSGCLTRMRLLVSGDLMQYSRPHQPDVCERERLKGIGGMHEVGPVVIQ